MAVEIERKFLLTSAAQQELIGLENPILMVQQYISFKPEIRIREQQKPGKEKNWKLCIKSKGSLSRIEVEKQLTESEYKQLETMRTGYVLQKSYQKDFHGFEAAFVKILGTDISFYYAEKEFDSAEEESKFRMSDFPFLARDITDEPDWKMAVIAQNGRLPELL